MQDAIRQIDGTGKIVATISPDDVRTAGEKSKSSLLATALKNGELIIAVTVQTFSHALGEIGADAGLKGKRSAVIAAEAHSSQSGQISSKLKQATVVWREVSKSWTEYLPFVLAADSAGMRRRRSTSSERPRCRARASTS